MALINRISAAWHAFMGNGLPVRFAVIYDEWEGAPGCGDVTESFYEVFQSPGEAAEFFREAFPEDSPVDNPRLVLILGSIDDFAAPPISCSRHRRLSRRFLQ